MRILRDAEQTVTLTVPPAPYIPAPKTGDSSKLGFWIGLAAVALGGVISAGIIRIKSRKVTTNDEARVYLRSSRRKYGRKP